MLLGLEEEMPRHIQRAREQLYSIADEIEEDSDEEGVDEHEDDIPCCSKEKQKSGSVELLLPDDVEMLSEDSSSKSTELDKIGNVTEETPEGLDDTVLESQYTPNESDDTEDTVEFRSPWASPARQRSCDLVDSLPGIKRKSWPEFVNDEVMKNSSGEDDGDTAATGIVRERSSREDPEWEPEDTEEFTARRIHGRDKRYSERDVDRRQVPYDQLPGNIEVMEDFQDYLKLSSSSTSASGEVVSTVAKYVGHMFSYGDSWLAHETMKDPEFTASRLFKYTHNDFLLMSSPLPWVNHSGTAKEWASRRKERLKAHASFRKYFVYRIRREKQKFGTGAMALILRGEIEGDIKKIDEDIQLTGLWDSLHKMEEQQRQTKIGAVHVLHPEEETNLKECIRIWNKSEIRAEKMKEVRKMWERSHSGIKPTAKKFVWLGNFVKFEVHIPMNVYIQYQTTAFIGAQRKQRPRSRL